MPLKFTALVDSKLKKFPIDSTLLSKGEVSPLPRGKSYEVTSWSKAEDDHIQVELAYGAGTWYFYDPHVHFPPVDDVPTVAPRASKSKFLTEDDYVQGAKMLNCSVPALKAVVAVEASGSGFLKDGRPKILYEAHIFGNRTNYRYNKTNPVLSSYRWDRSLYRKGGSSWQKLEQAMRLNEGAAICSASYGLFQVMGFHYKTCGFETPRDYYNAQFTSEFEHLRCAIAFIKSKKLDKHLRTLNWDAFSYGYNGSGYKVHQYHIKLANAYRRFAA